MANVLANDSLKGHNGGPLAAHFNVRQDGAVGGPCCIGDLCDCISRHIEPKMAAKNK
jgi:hypothetical protein